MRTFLKVHGLVFLCLLAVTSLASAQQFVNLDFEDAILPDPSPEGWGGDVPPEQALPGWSVSSDVAFVLHNNLTIGSPAVCIFGPGWPYPDYILQGDHSVLMQFAYLNPPTEIFISQTGLIPTDTRSVRLLCDLDELDEPLVYVAGQQVPMIVMASNGDVVQLGGDISSFAGTIAELKIQAPLTDELAGGWSLIDAITFSTEPIPEPATMLLLVFGGSTILRRRR